MSSSNTTNGSVLFTTMSEQICGSADVLMTGGPASTVSGTTHFGLALALRARVLARCSRRSCARASSLPKLTFDSTGTGV